MIDVDVHHYNPPVSLNVYNFYDETDGRAFGGLPQNAQDTYSGKYAVFIGERPSWKDGSGLHEFPLRPFGDTAVTNQGVEYGASHGSTPGSENAFDITMKNQGQLLADVTSSAQRSFTDTWHRCS